jgi:hypothetical protein
MYASRSLWLTGVLLGTFVAGCATDGGRGSSGFDITENVIISRVLETQQCLNSLGLTFCPADQQAGAVTATPTPTPITPTAPASPTFTPTVNPTPYVNTKLANGASIACTRSHVGAPCDLTFSFAGFGFPAGAAFRVASRLRAPDSEWTLTAPPVAAGNGDPAALDARVTLDVPAGATDPRVQFAVLVFLTPPLSVPAHFELLADSHTDFAFVTPEFALEIITSEPSPSATAAPPTPTPSAPTPTATETPLASGPMITYFGVTRADSFSLAPTDFDDAGRPIYVRPFGFSLSLVVEAAPGNSQIPVGQSAYAADGLPDLQMIVSRPLGDGSTVVCDRLPPTLGGVPATSPFAFADGAAEIAAINDLGCRVDDGQGNPTARFAGNACTLDRDGDYAFVDVRTTAQFCLPIAAPWAFPLGDTIVAARVRDAAGNLGPQREIVVRNAGSTSTSPTPATPTAPVTRTSASATPILSPTPAASGTPRLTVTATPTPSPTPPIVGAGPIITYLGVAHANDQPLASTGADDAGRPIYATLLGQGITLVVEARPGPAGRAPGLNAYALEGLPDLQMLVSRPLGNGSALVCDERPPLIGGVPATSPLEFVDDPRVADAVNDLGCRVDDGAGVPQARPQDTLACTTSELSGTGFGFVGYDSTVQYCLQIAKAWAFPVGDTVVAARVRDIAGNLGDTREIVVRVGQDSSPSLDR